MQSTPHSTRAACSVSRAKKTHKATATVCIAVAQILASVNVHGSAMRENCTGTRSNSEDKILPYPTFQHRCLGSVADFDDLHACNSEQHTHALEQHCDGKAVQSIRHIFRVVTYSCDPSISGSHHLAAADVTHCFISSVLASHFLSRVGIGIQIT